MREHDETENQEDKCQCFRDIVTEGTITEPDEAERDWMAEGMKRLFIMEKTRESVMRTGSARHGFFFLTKFLR